MAHGKLMPMEDELPADTPYSHPTSRGAFLANQVAAGAPPPAQAGAPPSSMPPVNLRAATGAWPAPAPTAEPAQPATAPITQAPAVRQSPWNLGGDEEALAESQRQRSMAGDQTGRLDPSLEQQEVEFAQTRRGKLGLLRGLQSADEAFRGMDWTTAHAQALGVRPRRPMGPDPALQGRIEDINDELSPAERDMVRSKWGFDPGPAARWSRVSDVLPVLTAQMRTDKLYGEGSYYGSKENRLWQQFELDKTAEGRRKEQGTERIELAKKGFSRVPDVDRRAIAGFDLTIERLGNLKGEYESVLGSFGPVAGRWTELARKLPWVSNYTDPEAVRTMADMNFLTSQFIYDMTGKQLNESEMRRLQAVLPQAWDNPENFRAVLDGIEETIRSKREIQILNLEKQGRDVTPFRTAGDGEPIENDMTPSAEGARTETASKPPRTRTKTAPAGRMRIVGPNGESGTVPAGTDLSGYPGWRRG